jgi:heat shock protein HslJ
MKNYILYFCALITLSFASSCKSPTDFDVDRWNDKDTTTYPAPQELAGEWYLAHYETFGNAPDSVPFQMYMINFETSKKISGKVNCNTLTAEYEAGKTKIDNVSDDKALSFKNITTTKMGCGTGDLDAKFTTALNTAKQYFVFGDMLEITYFGGSSTKAQRMIFRRKQMPNNNFDLLKGTEWTLVSFEHFGQAAEWIPVAFQADLNISFLGDSMAVGTAECGKFSAEYWTYNKPVPGTVDYPIGFNITNSVPCNGNYGGRFLDALKATKSYYRMGDSLEMTYNIGQGGTMSRMMFVKRQPASSGVAVRDSSVLVTELPDSSVVKSEQFITTKTGTIINRALTLKMQFSGGCGIHDFVSYGKVTQNGVEVLLAHYSNDPCDGIIQKDVTLHFDWFISEYKKLTGKQSGSVTIALTNAWNGQKDYHTFQF